MAIIKIQYEFLSRKRRNILSSAEFSNLKTRLQFSHSFVKTQQKKREKLVKFLRLIFIRVQKINLKEGSSSCCSVIIIIVIFKDK